MCAAEPTMSIPTISSAGAYAYWSDCIGSKRGMKKSARTKSAAVTTEARPVRAPSRMPVDDSM